MSLNRTIRLFVSSTFSDLKAERNVLQEHVFPRLKQLCLTRGFRFQAIDLRWGISEEAGRDNMTMRICLRELRRCQQDRPKPNFLILLGDRYGWRPLPEIIPAALFEKLSAHLRSADPEASQLLLQSYRIDNNAVPPAAELQPRRDDESWHDRVAKPLLSALEQAAQALGLDLEQAGVSIGASATEQEIIEGALRVPDAATHVCAFFRTIGGLPDDPPPRDFVDVGEPQARPQLEALKRRIQNHLGSDSICHYRVPWGGTGIDTNDLKEFCDLAWKHLSEVVEQQIAAITEVPPEVLEEQAHQDFGAERCRHFVGREEPLRKIAVYLSQGSDALLALVGPSGSGKSAVMARVVHVVRETNPKAQIIARFIGATPASADLIQLLRNVVAEIRKRYPAAVAAELASGEGGKAKPGDAEIPIEFNPLVSAFHEALQRPTAAEPLFLFLDSLDQLTASHSAHSLTWLPAKLSNHVRLIVSAALPSGRGSGEPSMSSATTDPRTAVMAALTSRLNTNQSVTLAPLSVEDGEQMLTNWLADARRALQAAQRQAILRTFQFEGSPLWLRTATEEAARLADWDPAPSFQPTPQGLLGQVLARLSREEEHGGTLVSRTLSYLACARHGLAEDEILDILSADPEVMADFVNRSPTERAKREADRVKTLPVAVWVRLHGDLGFYLAEHLVQGASLLGFYHRSFLEAVSSHCLADREDRRLRHQHLVDWFGKQAWFLAPASEDPSVPPREARIEDPPNARKASELPWQLYKTADEADPTRCREAAWQPLSDVLCDILLLEAKVRSGLVLELEEDYRLALDALPEMGPELKERQEREAQIKRWTAEIIAYARAWSERRDRQGRGQPILEPEPVFPESVPSCRMWTREGFNTECRRICENPTRLDRLRAFARFVTSQNNPLTQFCNWCSPSFVLKHAFNYQSEGPVHDAARPILQALRKPYFARRWSVDEHTHPVPALLRILSAYDHGLDMITCVRVTPDGRRAVSTDFHSVLRVWSLESGQCLLALHAVPALTPSEELRSFAGRGYVSEISAVSVTPDGRYAVTGNADSTIQMWNLLDGICLVTLDGHTGGVHAVSVTPDGRRAVSGSDDKTLRVWDLKSGQCLRTLDGHIAPVYRVCVLPDGRRAVSGDVGCTVRVWNLENGSCQQSLEGQAILNVAADGRRALLVGLDCKLREWDMDSLQCLRILPWAPDVETLKDEYLMSDGRYLVTTSGGTTLRVLDLESGECLGTLEGHNGRVTEVSVTLDGRRAVSGSVDGTLQVWNLESGHQRPVDRHDSEVNCVCVTPDERRAVSSSADQTLRVWDLASGKCLRILRGHTNGVEGLTVTPDGKSVVSGSRDMTLRVWDLESGQCMRILEGHTDPVNCVSVTSDGLHVVSAARLSMSVDDTSVRVWDLENGQCLRARNMKGPGGIRCMSVIPDSWRVVIGFGFGDLATFDMGSGEIRAQSAWAEGHESMICSVSTTSDGRCAVSGGLDNTMRVWNLDSISDRWIIRSHSSAVRGVSVTPDGRFAVSGSWNAWMQMWNLGKSELVDSFLAPGPISSVAISHSGSVVVCGMIAGGVIILEPRGIESGPLVTSAMHDSANASHREPSYSRLLRLIPFLRKRP